MIGHSTCQLQVNEDCKELQEATKEMSFAQSEDKDSKGTCPVHSFLGASIRTELHQGIIVSLIRLAAQ